MSAPPVAARAAVVEVTRPAKGTTAVASQPRPSQLADQLAADLEAAFEGLVLTYQDELYRFAVGMTGDAAAGQEVVQDALVNAYRALRTYDAPRIRTLALRPWLYRITLNLCRNRRRSRRPDLVLGARTPDAPDSAPGPEAAALREEQRIRLVRALGSLPLPLRAPTVLKYGRDLSYSEIAELLDEPVGTVKAQVHRGIAALRLSLKDEELMP